MWRINFFICIDLLGLEKIDHISQSFIYLIITTRLYIEEQVSDNNFVLCFHFFEINSHLLASAAIVADADGSFLAMTIFPNGQLVI